MLIAILQMSGQKNTSKNMKDKKNFYFPECESTLDIMYYNAANHAVAHCPRKKDRYTIDTISNSCVYIKGYLELIIKTHGKPLSNNAFKFIDYCHIELSRVNELRTDKTKTIPITMLKIDFDELAEVFGKNDPKAKYRFRQQIIEDLDSIFNTEINYQYEDKKNVYRGRILSGYKPFEYDQKYIIVVFDERYVSYSMRYITKIDKRLFQLDDRHSKVYMLARKLFEHYFSEQMINNGTYDFISVKKLLEAIPDFLSEEEIKEKHNRNFKELIISPFEKILNTLVDMKIISEWTYLKAGRQKLTDIELANYGWEEFKNFYVNFKILEKPNVALN